MHTDSDTWKEENKIELEELKDRIELLEKTFKHMHVNKHDGTDKCSECGLDLRDAIHLRIGERK